MLKQAGMTLIEVVVMLAIVLVLASVIAPSLIAYADEQRVEATKTILDAVTTGLVGANGFRATVGTNAGRVSQLTNRITAGNAALDDDSCGGSFAGGDPGQWDNNAPYVGFIVPRGGLPTPIGVAEDTMTRIPNNNAVGVNEIIFKSVDMRDILLLDALIDNGDGFNLGTVRWNASPLVLRYRITLDNKC